jgi:hypothetical protein
MSVLELVSSHPFLCKRAAALREYQRPGSVQPVSRNVLAVILAPMFGVAAAPAGGAGAGMMVIAVVGMMSVMGIYGVRKYIETAKHLNEAAQVSPYGTEGSMPNRYGYSPAMAVPVGSAIDDPPLRQPPLNRFDPNRRRVLPQQP